MKRITKFLGAFAILLCIVIPNKASAVACYNFPDTAIYYNLDGYYESLNGWATSHRDWESSALYVNGKQKAIVGTKALQAILEAESFTISADEKKKGDYGFSTASAVVQFQNKYKDEILTPRGFAAGTGIVDSETRKVLNQKYGCIEKAVIDLTSPNGVTIKARGEVLPIKWTASKVPNKATLNINYVKSDGTATTSIATTTISNGKGSYDWTIPSTISTGKYKVQLLISGAVKSDISAKPFEIREKALEITSPTSSVELSKGQKLTINWKTSSLIKPSDKIKISLSGTLVSGGSSSTTIELAKPLNTGSYVWTVPERLNNNFVTATSTFKLVLETENGTYKSVSSNDIKIKPNTTGAVTLNITSPTSNAEYNVGKKLPIKWTSKGLTASDEVEIGLNIGGSINNGNYRIQKQKNTGSFEWAIPQEIRSNILLATTTRNIYSIVISPTANTSVSATSGNFSITPVSAPNITLTSQSSTQTIGRGSDITVNWTANGAVPSTAKLNIILIKNVGGATAATLKSAVNAKDGTAVVKIPATMLADAYRIVLVPTGVKLDSSSVLKSALINVTIQNASFTSTSLNSNEVYRGESLTVNWVSNNIPSKSNITASVLTDSGNLTTIKKVTAPQSAGKLVIPIPTSELDGKYKVYLSAIVDGQTVSTLIPFEIKTRVPSVNIISPNDNTDKKGKSFVISWKNENFSSVAKSLELSLIQIDGDALALGVIKSGLATNLTNYTFTLPTNGTLGSARGIGTNTSLKYKIQIRVLDSNGKTLAQDSSEQEFKIIK